MCMHKFTCIAEVNTDREVYVLEGGGEQREHECTMRLQCSRQISVITKSEEAAASGRGEFTQEITWQSAFRTDLKCCCIKGP